MPKGVPNKRYTGEFKKMVVETMMREKLSYREAARQFEIDKHRVSIRLTAPYSEERKTAASERATMHTPFSSIYSA